MEKEFSLLQLLSLTDGRLSTNIGDVYDILNHITGESLMTHHLPVAGDYLKLINPEWFQKAMLETDKANDLIGGNFLDLIEIVKESNLVYQVPPFTDEEKAGFGEYMIENSLLLKKMK